MEAILKVLHKAPRMLNRGVNEVEVALPALILALIKLNLLALFFWYCWGFTWELWSQSQVAALLVAGTGVVCIIFIIWKIIAASIDEWETPEAAVKKGVCGRSLCSSSFPLPSS